jgi:hypothetical protein
MMRKILIAAMFTLTTLGVVAQRDSSDKKRGFDVERMFIGGSISLGLGNGNFTIGANPQVGYSVFNWLDAGITTNINYYTQRSTLLFNNAGYSLRQKAFNYGGGPFIRICPISMIHLQAQYEYNWISGTVEDLQTGAKEKFNVSAPSLLIGAGYGRRFVGESFFFTTILFDITKDDHSPYVYVEGSSKIALPIIRAGFNVYFRKRKE